MKGYANLDDLLSMAQGQKEEKEFTIKIPRMAKEMKLKAINRMDFLDIQGSSSKDKDAELIYECCIVPSLKDNSLIEKLGCKENPNEVVTKIFNYAEVREIAEIILVESGFANSGIEKIVDDIKN